MFSRPEATAVSQPRSSRVPAFLYIALLLCTVLLFGLIRYRLRAMPLERDEGEYAYAGQLLLQRIPPYQLAYNMKLPGIYAAYAIVLAAFGETPAGIHVGLLFINAAATLLLFCLTLNVFGRAAALAAAAGYALLSTSFSVMGFEAHATHFVVVPAILAILLLRKALESQSGWRFFSSGLLCGIALLMKQHGIFFVFFCLFYLVASERKQKSKRSTLARHAAVLISGAVLPYAFSCWLLYRAGVFHEFWFWTVSYAGEYSKIGLHRAVHTFLENFRTAAEPAAPIWLLAAVGLSALLWNARARAESAFLGGLFCFSFLALCPGGYFRPHYFILFLPVTAMLAGVAVSLATEKLAARQKSRNLAIVPALIIVVAFGYSVWQQREFYFFLDPDSAFRATYGDGPFLPAVKVAGYIKEHSPEDARIAVLGSEPEIYFYAKRHSATGYIYMYSLIGRQKYTAPMREQMIGELKSNCPEYLIYVDVWDSWGDRNGDAELAAFLARLQLFMNEQYEKVGVADIGDSTRYIWGDAAQTYLPQSSKVLYVLKRKN